MRYTFKKEERLCSKRLIEGLFHNGSSFFVYPYRLVFLFRKQEDADKVPAQCMLSVSKRRFRKAVDRNAIKRLMREVYRLQKIELYSFLEEHSLHLLLAIQYVGKEKESYDMLFQRMGKVISKLKDEGTPIHMGNDH